MPDTITAMALAGGADRTATTHSCWRTKPGGLTMRRGWGKTSYCVERCWRAFTSYSWHDRSSSSDELGREEILRPSMPRGSTCGGPTSSLSEVSVTWGRYLVARGRDDRDVV